MDKSGIYKILNIFTKDFYIGSSYNIFSRFRAHRHLLKKNKHHSVYLQNSWNKYGEINFKLEIIEYCDIKILLEKEQYYLDLFKPIYNMSKDSSSPMKGRKHKQETLDKYKNRKVWNKGIPRTEDEKKLISQNRKGIPVSEEHKQKLKNYYLKSGGYWKGKNLSEKVKKIISDKAYKIKIECSNGKIYNSQLEAAKDLNIKQGHISECCNDKRSHVKGYTFKKL
jgi:group I intron endonuclease